VLTIVLRCLFDGALGDDERVFVDQMRIPLDYANRTPLQRIDKTWFGPYRRAVKARAAMDTIVFDVIARRRGTNDRRDDILGWLIEAQDNGHQLNDQEVRDQVISLIAAAYDTTSSVAGWIAMRLADDSSLAGAVNAEVAAVTDGSSLRIEHLPGLRLTAAVVNEVLRMHPPALIAPRFIADSFDLHGHHIRAGGMLMYAAYTTHMDPEQFPNPETFKPTRWLEGDPDHRPHHPYAFLPFGGGSRRCIGFAFALQELTVMTALLAQRNLTPMYTAPPKPQGIASMAPKSGVPVRIG
jgi:cytochrome P450